MVDKLKTIIVYHCSALLSRDMIVSLSIFGRENIRSLVLDKLALLCLLDSSKVNLTLCRFA